MSEQSPDTPEGDRPPGDLPDGQESVEFSTKDHQIVLVEEVAEEDGEVRLVLQVFGPRFSFEVVGIAPESVIDWFEGCVLMVRAIAAENSRVRAARMTSTAAESQPAEPT